MNIAMILLRLVHLFSAFIWVGTTFAMALFIGPTAQAVGSDAQKFMQHFLMRSNLTKITTATGILTVLTGLSMYGYLFQGRLAPLNSGSGLALTVGGLAGIGALSVGLGMGQTIRRMRAVSAEIAKAGGPPKPEQLANLGKLQEKLARAGAINTILMSLALVGMTLSEYFAF